MTPGFPKTWKPCKSLTWAAVRLPCLSFLSHRPGAGFPAFCPHSSKTPKWNTRGPSTAPRPRAGVQEPPQGKQGGWGEPGCPLPGPTGMGDVIGRPPAHSGDRGPRQPRALGTVERSEDGGGGESGRPGEGTNGRRHSPLAGPGPTARARSPEAGVPKRLGTALVGDPSEARREGAVRMRALAGSARPHAHTPSRQPRPRAGILAAAGSHGAPGGSLSARRVGASPSSARSAIWARASLSLSSAPVWGRLPRTLARRAPLPLPLSLAVQSPGARAQPMCAAAWLRPGAQWPRPRWSCAP